MKAEPSPPPPTAATAINSPAEGATLARFPSDAFGVASFGPAGDAVFAAAGGAGMGDGGSKLAPAAFTAPAPISPMKAELSPPLATGRAEAPALPAKPARLPSGAFGGADVAPVAAAEGAPGASGWLPSPLAATGSKPTTARLPTLDLAPEKPTRQDLRAPVSASAGLPFKPPSDSLALVPDEWYFVDLQGVTQGPFAGEQMGQWESAGFFSPDTLVRRGGEGQGDLMPLSAVAASAGGAAFTALRTKAEAKPAPIDVASVPHPARQLTARSAAVVETLGGLEEELKGMESTLTRADAALGALGAGPLPVGLRSELASLHGSANKLLATRLDGLLTGDLTTAREEARGKRKALVATAEALIERTEAQIRQIDHIKAARGAGAKGSMGKDPAVVAAARRAAKEKAAAEEARVAAERNATEERAAAERSAAVREAAKKAAATAAVAPKANAPPAPARAPSVISVASGGAGPAEGGVARQGSAAAAQTQPQPPPRQQSFHGQQHNWQQQQQQQQGWQQGQGWQGQAGWQGQPGWQGQAGWQGQPGWQGQGQQLQQPRYGQYGQQYALQSPRYAGGGWSQGMSQAGCGQYPQTQQFQAWQNNYPKRAPSGGALWGAQPQQQQQQQHQQPGPPKAKQPDPFGNLLEGFRK